MKSFCRTITLVNHQRRCHQRNLFLNEVKDTGFFNFDEGKDSAALVQHTVPWPIQRTLQNNDMAHHSTSLASFNQRNAQHVFPNVADYCVQQRPVNLQHYDSLLQPGFGQQPLFWYHQQMPSCADCKQWHRLQTHMNGDTINELLPSGADIFNSCYSAPGIKFHDLYAQLPTASCGHLAA